MLFRSLLVAEVLDFPQQDDRSLGLLELAHRRDLFPKGAELAVQIGAGVAGLLEVGEWAVADGGRVVAMSQQAFDSLNDEQLQALHGNGDVVAVPIDTIEASAGGSVRCMLAEVHLPGGDPVESQ